MTTENSGLDMRQIPADNIESVEVIRGIPFIKIRGSNIRHHRGKN